jgi:hypothetical protein
MYCIIEITPQEIETLFYTASAPAAPCGEQHDRVDRDATVAEELLPSPALPP